MARTQIRLDAVTGSLALIDGVASAQAAPASIAASDLQDVLGQFAGAIKRIHGAAAFTNQRAGAFSHTIDVTGHISGSENIVLTKAGAQVIEKRGTGNLSVELSGAGKKLDVLTNGAMRLSVSDTVVSSSLLTVMQDARVENVGGADGSLVFRNLAKELRSNNNLKFDGSDLVAPSAKVSDLTEGRVVYVAASGSLVDSGEMTFGAGGLTLSKDLTARSGSFGGDVTISGDLFVNGNTVTVDVGTLTIEDKNVVIAKDATGALLDGAGIFLGSELGESIAWNHADTKWVASDKFMADTLQAGDLSEAIVWADANGNLTEITNQSLADAIEGRLAAGTGVSISEASAVITVAIGQAVATTDNVTFAGVKVSGLSSAPLAADADGDLVEMDFTSWVLGTANQVVVSGSGTDFHGITLSLPQDIHTGATPEFAALNLGSYGDLLASGSDFKVQAAADLFLADAQGSFKLSEAAGDWTSFVTNFGDVSLVEALNSLAGGAVAGKGKWAKTIAADIVGGAYTFVGADQVGGSTVAPDLDAAADRTEIYLNGQLMVAGADYTVSDAQVDFEFDLKADDVVVAIIR
jgi:hypothetical protein